MAQYRLSVNVIGRSAGRSATGAAAYRSASRIVDERTGLIHDYTRKTGVLHTEIMAPENAPDWMRDRAELWNAVEAAERRKDAQLSREIQLSLPHELNQLEQVHLVRRFIQDKHVSQGMIADIAIHEPSSHDLADERNYHAHVMLTMRSLTGEGFGQKAREWNDKQLLEDWRKDWAEYQNETFRTLGLPCRVDHRSLEEQGIMREPQQHMGPVATDMMRNGKHSRQEAANDVIDRRNGLREDLLQAENLIDAKIAFEKRKLAAWQEKKRGQLEIDRQHVLASYQLGMASRMEALDTSIAAEFGDTKDYLTYHQGLLSQNLSTGGWRGFIRDITLTTRRERKELERIEQELEQTRLAEERKRQHAIELEAKRKAALLKQQALAKQRLEKGIQKAQERREANEWAPLPSPEHEPVKIPQKPYSEQFNEAANPSEHEHQHGGDKSGDEQIEIRREFFESTQRDLVSPPTPEQDTDEDEGLGY